MAYRPQAQWPARLAWAAFVLVLWLAHKPITRSRLLQIAPFVALGLGMGLLTLWWERYHQGTAGGLFAIGWLERRGYRIEPPGEGRCPQS